MNTIRTLLAIGEGKQIANSFDKATLVKVLKGALISACGAFALAILGAVNPEQITNPILAPMVAFMVPTLINAIKEYLKGSR